MSFYDFLPGAAYALDRAFDVMYGPTGSEEERARDKLSNMRFQSVVTHGAFFGELLRRTLGGTWRADPRQPDNAFFVTLDLPNGISCFPIARALKRLKNGEEDGFFVMYVELRRRLARGPLPGERESWLRHADFLEDTNRFEPALFCLAEAERIEPARAAELAERRARIERAIAEEKEERRQNRPRWERPATRDELAELAKVGERELDAMGVLPDYGIASIAVLDVVLNGLWGNDPIPAAARESDVNKTRELHLGAYLGELFVRRLGGAWELDPGRVDCSHVTWTNGSFKTCPFAYFSKRMENGAGHSVYSQTTFLRQMLGERKDVPPPDRAAEAPEWAAQARAQLERGKTALALQLAQFAIDELDPHCVEAHLVVAAARGDGPAAQRPDDEPRPPPEPPAAPLDASPEAQLERDRRITREGSLPEAIEAFRRILAIHPDDADSIRELSVALALSGRADEALAMADRAIALDPRDVRSFDNKIVTLARSGRFAEAIACIDAALAHHPRSATLLFRRGNYCARLGRLDEALDYFGRVRAIDPVHAEALVCEAEVLGRKGRKVEALDLLALCLRLPELRPKERELALRLRSEIERRDSKA